MRATYQLPPRRLDDRRLHERLFDAAFSRIRPRTRPGPALAWLDRKSGGRHTVQTQLGDPRGRPEAAVWVDGRYVATVRWSDPERRRAEVVTMVEADFVTVALEWAGVGPRVDVFWNGVSVTTGASLRSWRAAEPVAPSIEPLPEPRPDARRELGLRGVLLGTAAMLVLLGLAYGVSSAEAVAPPLIYLVLNLTYLGLGVSPRTRRHREGLTLVVGSLVFMGILFAAVAIRDALT